MSSFLQGLLGGFSNSFLEQRKQDQEQSQLHDMLRFHNSIGLGLSNTIQIANKLRNIRCAYCLTQIDTEDSRKSCKNCGASEYV